MPWNLLLLPLGLMLLTPPEALARGPWRASEGNTSGWTLMTPEERIEHQTRIRGFTTLDACAQYRDEHHHRMAARAAERGLNLREGRHDFCAHLRPTEGQR